MTQNLFTSFHQHHQRIPHIIGLILAIVILSLPFTQVTPAQALPAGFQEYLVIGDEYQIYRMFRQLPGGDTDFTDYEMRSIVTLVATSGGQKIYYDQWEDGYETDIFNPTSATTLIFGDGNPANGDSGSGSDTLDQGVVLSLKSNVSGSSLITGTVDVASTRNPAEIRYDSRDRVVSTGGPVSLVHAMWPTDNTYVGGAWEVYSFQAWRNGTSYTVPVGVDSYTNNGGDTGPFGDFRFVWLEVQAAADNTNVTIDNGTDAPVTITLNRGDTYASSGYINDTAAPALTVNEGTTVNANKPVQAGMVTGADGGFQTRFFSMIPNVVWGTEYLVPVASAYSSSVSSQVYLFNPNDHQITVNASDQVGTGTITIPANGARAYSQDIGHTIPQNSGAQLSSDSIFWAIGSHDYSNTSYDWGYSLIPVNFLTSDYYISWAPGSNNTPPTENGSPIHVTPRDDNTTFYVDYSPTDGTVDQTFTLNTLERGIVLDPDNDNTGVHIWTDNKPFMAVWGETPPYAGAADPYLDLGTTILPLYQGWLDPVLTIEKTANTSIIPATGGTVTFQLNVDSYSFSPLGTVNVTDTLPPNWTYVSNSATLVYPDGSTVDLEPTINGQELSWNLGQTMLAHENLLITFDAQLDIPGGLTSAAENWESGDYTGGTGWAGEWIETDSGSGDGYVQNTTSGTPHGGNRHLMIAGSNSISRTINLSNSFKPTLNFWRKTSSLDRNNESFTLDVSDNDGLTWTTLLTFANNDNEDIYVSQQIDLSDYKAANSAIRFTGNNNLETDDYLYIDDIQIFDAGTIHENVATAIGTYGNNVFEAGDNEFIYVSALSLDKTVDKSEVLVGDTLAYTLSYFNSGAVTATNVAIRDVLPANTSFADVSGGGAYISATNTVRWGPLSVPPMTGGVVTFTVTADNVADGTILNNVARIDSDQTMEATSNQVETTIVAPALSLSKSGPTTVAPSDTITYTLNYANNGHGSATSVIISDTLPVSTTYVAGSLAINTGSGWTTLSDDIDTDAGQYSATTISVQPGVLSGTLAAGESGQVRFAVVVDAGASQGASIDNVATIDSAQTIRQYSNLFPTDISPLSISKSSDRSIAAPGQTVAITIGYANSGTSSLSDISLIDSIPANTSLISGTVTGVGMDSIAYSTNHGLTWSSTFTNPALVTDIRWNRAALPDSESGTVGFQIILADPLPANTTIQNTAKITSTQTAASGWLYSNPIAIGTVDLTISKIAHTAFVRAGNPITYTITYGNNGSVAATGATISDMIPANTTYVSGSIFGSGADDSDPTNPVWNLTIPANSGGYKAGFVVTVTNGTAAGTAIDNIAAVSNAYDSAASNQVQVTVAQDGVTISPNRSDNTHDQGQQICYGHTVGNTGNLTNTMELSATHNTWTSATVSFYRDNDADGNYDAGLDTALADTNINTTVDTGELTPGQQIKILACFTIPTGAADDDSDSLTVQAITADGDTYTSQVTDLTTVRIENFLTIISPVAGLVTNTTSINYSGTTNPNATVVMTNTTTGIAYTVTADGFGNFATTITTTLGTNTITAQSTDLDDDVAVDTRTITRTSDTTDSTNDVTIIQPTTGAITSTTTVSVTGTTDPGSTITVTIGSAGPFTATADDSGNFSLAVTLPELGTNTIEVTSTDPFGNVDTATRDVTLTNDTSDITNTLTITSPTEGQVITTSTISAIGQTDPGNTITITVSTGDVVTGTASLTDGTFNIGGVDLITGTNVITIVSTDPYGNLITETVTVILTNDTTPSQNELTITAPVSGTITTATSISVIGNTDPGSAITITTAAGTFTGTTGNNGAFSTSVSLAYGWNTIVVTGTDVYGQVATDTVRVRLTNDTTPDSNNVAIIFPPMGYVTNTVTIPVTGTANTDSVITVTVGSAGPFTTTADSNGVYTVTVTLPATGTNTIAITATDIYGNQATATREVTLTDDDTPDSTTVAVTSPPAGYMTTATTTTVTGTGDPGATISIMVEGSGPFTATVGADGTFTITVDLPTAGINTIEVTATDPYHNIDTASRDVLRHPFINFSGGSYSTNEGGTATITVTLSAVSNVTTTVAYATANGTAQAGSDYTGASGVLTFTAGITSQTINIPIANDGLDENNETFNITLSNPVSATLGTVDNTTVTIIDGNDPPTVSFSTSSASADEGSGVYTITVELDTASGLDVTVPFTVSGTATEGASDDFTIVNSPITIPAGQTSAVITVTLNEDTAAEGDETIIVEIGTPTNATPGTTGSFTLTIVDDDFTLTRYTDGNGSIEPDPDQSTYTYGDVITLSASADPGWAFQSWSGDATGTTSPVTLTMTNDQVVTATFTQDQYTLETNVTGQGTVLTTPAKSTYTYGEVVTLTAFANFGWTFAGWSGDLSGSSTTETITVTGDTSVGATFTHDAYTLTINQSGNGSVISSPAQSTYNYGDTITLTATADPGWTFQNWSGDLTSSDNPYSFEISGHTAVTATFTQDAYTLDLNPAGNGTISVDPNNPTYSYGEVVTLTATANPGWTFTGWSGDVSGSNSQQSVTITGTMIITANFSRDEYTLAVTTVGNGSVVSTPVQSTYHYGDVVTLTATADSGWTFVGWSGDLSGTNGEDTVTITGNTAVTATFSQNAYTLDVSVVGNGSVVSTPVKSTYNYGEVVTLTAIADSGWNFANWSGDATGTTTPVTVTMTGNRAVIATFTKDTSTTLDFSKTAVDVNGESLLVTDTIRYTLQVTNTGGYTAGNVVVTDTLPAGVDLVEITHTQGTHSGSQEIVWTVGELAGGSTATMVITVTLNAASLNQSIVNNASVGADNAQSETDAVCPTGEAPVNGVCETKPQEPAEPTTSYGVFLPIIFR